MPSPAAISGLGEIKSAPESADSAMAIAAGIAFFLGIFSAFSAFSVSSAAATSSSACFASSSACSSVFSGATSGDFSVMSSS